MTPDRSMAELDPAFDAQQFTGYRPVVLARQADLAVTAQSAAALPAAARIVDDGLARLLADPAADGGGNDGGGNDGGGNDGGDGEAGQLDLALLGRLARARAQQAVYAEQAKALIPLIEQLDREVVEHVALVTGADLRRKWSTTVTVGGKAYTAYVKTTDYPAYRVKDGDDEGGEKFGMPDLVAALKASTTAGLPEMVKETVNGNTWNAAIGRMVDAWRVRVDETGGPRNAAGEPIDAYGNVLTATERDDPTADELGLPPEIRALVRVAPSTRMMFRQQ